ncbi:MAG: DNA-binding protein WhiA [Clostridiales bacterium]|nr:DNA-binding protein WhiA [Clostridiales bacterium]
MSFSMQVKNELVKKEYEKPCCKKSLLYGMCIFGKSFNKKSISLQTENPQVASLYADLMKNIFNIDTDIKKSPKGRNFTVFVKNRQDCEKIIRLFGHDSAGSIKINYAVFMCEDCSKAFTAGAFLSCGTISDPNKDYHLEFSVAYLNLSKSLFTLLDELELNPKYTNRKGYNVIYFKESEAIEDCLYIMGASDSMFEMMNIEIIKDFRNKANRQANCESANINKMVNAVSVQVRAIEKIWNKKGKNYLNPALEAVAELRYDNPDSSLSELASMCVPELSRSGINHRLKKIVDISKEL